MLKNLNNIFAFAKSYMRYDLKREVKAWLKTLKFYSPLLILVAVIAIAISFYTKPFPIGKTYLATGQVGSISDQMGKDFVEHFTQYGLELQTESTAGLDSGLVKLGDAASTVNASFVTAGTATRKDYPDLVSLGSVEIAPLWLFYRGKTVEIDDPFEYYRDKRIGIGSVGTVTHKLFGALMELNNPGTGERENFLKLSHADGAQSLRSGQIDALFIVDGFDSPVIQTLLNDPTIKLMNFPLADAYVEKMPFLQKVVVPKASVDINSVRPEKDIVLLASNVNLLIEKDVHPTIQWAFLLAAQDLNLKTQRFFRTAGPFPAYRDKSFPLSPIADQFYTNGRPALFQYLPFRLAGLLANIWVVLLVIFLVALPIFNQMIGYRAKVSQKLIWKHFWQLRYLEDQLKDARDTAVIEHLIRELQELDRIVASTWIAALDMRHYYRIRMCIKSSIQDANLLIEKQAR